MRKPEDAKKVYDNIEIPEELGMVVENAIASVDKEKYRKINRNQKMIRYFRTCSAAAAAVAVCLIVGLNTSETFAKEMSGLPVIGPIARVLTIRSFEEKTEDYDVKVDVPEVHAEIEEMGISDLAVGDSAVVQNVEDELEAEAFLVDINAEIQEIVDNHIAQAKEKFDEYKKSFFAAGGTEEEWNERDITINVDYEVKYMQGNRLSLVLITDEAWVNAYEVHYYYNVDLAENRELSLKDMLGERYVEIANTSILSQMEEQAAADENVVYWGINDGEELIEGFTTVDEDTDFYINAEGNPVVCFEKYEVAPGYMGICEFEIPVSLAE